MERYRQYGAIDDRTRIYAQAVGEFLDVSEVTRNVLSPPPSNGLLDRTFMFWSVRLKFLRTRRQRPRVFSMSFLAAGYEFAHGSKPFSSITPIDATAGAEQAEDVSAVLAEARGTSNLTRGSSGWFTPLSVNCADTGDTCHHDPL